MEKQLLETKHQEAQQETERLAETRLQEAEEKRLVETKLQETEREKRTAKREKRLAETRRQEAEREKQIAETRLQEAEARQQEAETRRQEAETRQQEAERLAETRLEEAMTRRQEAETRRQEADTRRQEAETRRQEADTRRQEAERRIHDAETETWVVDRSEIQVTREELGRGGWATVFIATFRGIRVAAKVIHGQILSPHNISLFKREMKMAARIRHPNLLQFIGATQEGEMVILTELMPTRELEQDYMSLKPATSIGLDVLKGLNYLHQMRPHPLIHRDISSANVLLEPLANGRWKAKISDYGTVNLVQQLRTINPGSPCYSAPEANDPTMQSPKMDIFSFGALLLEMLTGELPAPDERPRLLGAIHRQPLLTLIQRCLSVNRNDRPSASDIITELDS